MKQLIKICSELDFARFLKTFKKIRELGNFSKKDFHLTLFRFIIISSALAARFCEMNEEITIAAIISPGVVQTQIDHYDKLRSTIANFIVHFETLCKLKSANYMNYRMGFICI